MDVTPLSTSAPLDAADPVRPPDWRWSLARQLLDSGRPVAPSRCDLLTTQLIEFLRRRRQCLSDRARRRLAAELPDIAGAVALREQTHPSIRAVIEARILARQTADEISALVGLPAGVIAAFERLCFDVRDRLENADYIEQLLIHAARDAAADYRSALRLLGYRGGPEALNEVLPAASADGAGLQPTMAALEAATAALLEARLHLAVGQGADRGGTNPSSPLLSLAAKRQQTRPPVDTTNEYQEAFRRLLEALPFRLGPPDPETRCPALLPFDERGIELTASEELIVTLGGILPNQDHLLKSYIPPAGQITPDHPD